MNDAQRRPSLMFGGFSYRRFPLQPVVRQSLPRIEWQVKLKMLSCPPIYSEAFMNERFGPFTSLNPKKKLFCLF